jgi:hypothetical protein
MQTNNILKVFITHQANLQATLDKVSLSFTDYVVVVGGHEDNSYENNVIKLSCDDSYCGLPDKVTSMFKFISENSAFYSYTHFHKLDEDMELIKEIDFELTDYMGMIAGKHIINRNHHIGRCEGHYWNDKPYEGEISDWCEGGLGYIVSRKAIECIAQVDGKQYPLEDVMVGNILENNGIYPRFTNMNKYYRPNQWYNPIRTYQDFKGKEWRDGGIPKWIFKTGPMSEDALPEVMKYIFYDMIDKNPGYQLFYFSDHDCMMYIYDYYGQEYFRAYDTLIPTAYKADFWRYLILFKHGGCYGDFSQAMLTSFDSIIEGVDRVLVVDTPEASDALYNAFMCVKSGDGVVRRAIDKCKDNIDRKNYGYNTLDVTGPRVLGRAYCEVVYKNSKPFITIGKSGTTNILNNAEMHGNFIVDNNGQPIILKKINNHWNIIYHNRGMKHYGELWNERKVFK